MGTPHINAEKGDFSNVVLIAGDPNRAKWIAETYLHDVKQVNAVRGALGYTGLTKNNKRISVMTSGMGQPSIGIYSYELYSYFDVDIIIRIGTCGVYQPNINLFDVLIAATASTDSNWASQYKINGTYSAGARPGARPSGRPPCRIRTVPAGGGCGPSLPRPGPCRRSR